MSDLRKAAQQALEALEAGPDVDPIFAGETEAALRAALVYKCRTERRDQDGGGGEMNRDEISRWEAEIEGWRQRYEALLKTLADHQFVAPPVMLADKQSYELGLLHGAAAEREACAKVCEEHWEIDGSRTAQEFAAAIRARGQA